MNSPSLRLFLIYLFFGLSSQAKALTPYDFDKAIDLNQVEVLFNQPSEDAIIAFIQSHVQLYRIETTDANKSPIKAIAKLPAAPQELINYFGPQTLGKILGLFVPYEEHSSVLKNDIILLRDDAAAWTIIHEYMHFLYNQSRRAKGVQGAVDFKSAIEDSTESYLEIMNFYRQNSRFQNLAQMKEYVQALHTLVTVRLGNILNFSVEEVMVETELQKRFLSNSMHFLSVEDYDSSKPYIQKNLKIALRDTLYVLQLIQEARQILSADAYSRIAPELDFYQQKYENILRQLPTPPKNQDAKPVVYKEPVVA